MKKNNWLLLIPFYWIQLLCEKWWGKALRVCVFQMGEYGRFSILRKIIHRYEKKPRFMSKEVDYFLKILEQIGGKKAKKRTEDGGAIIEYMIFRAEDLRKIIREKGGIWEDVPLEQRGNRFYRNPSGKRCQIIYRPFDDTLESWKIFFHQVLHELGWEKIALVDENGIEREAYLTHIGDFPFQEKNCFLRCHSPGKSFPMEVLYIGSHLGMNCDVCVFDYRGTYNSSGKPSEGGYYLDADCIYKELIQTFRYFPHQIWVTGFSLGGAVAAFIKKKYHKDGVNYIAENTFSSLQALIASQNWLVHFLGMLGKESIEAKEEEILDLVYQDFFNTLQKLSSLADEEALLSRTIIIQTVPDTIVPPKSPQLLYESAKTFGEATLLFYAKKPEVMEGHMDRPLEDRRFWRQYARALSTTYTAVQYSRFKKSS